MITKQIPTKELNEISVDLTKLRNLTGNWSLPTTDSFISIVKEFCNCSMQRDNDLVSYFESSDFLKEWIGSVVEGRPWNKPWINTAEQLILESNKLYESIDNIKINPTIQYITENIKNKLIEIGDKIKFPLNEAINRKRYTGLFVNDVIIGIREKFEELTKNKMNYFYSLLNKRYQKIFDQAKLPSNEQTSNFAKAINCMYNTPETKPLHSMTLIRNLSEIFERHSTKKLKETRDFISIIEKFKQILEILEIKIELKKNLVYEKLVKDINEIDTMLKEKIKTADKIILLKDSASADETTWNKAQNLIKKSFDFRSKGIDLEELNSNVQRFLSVVHYYRLNIDKRYAFSNATDDVPVPTPSKSSKIIPVNGSMSANPKIDDMPSYSLAQVLLKFHNMNTGSTKISSKKDVDELLNAKVGKIKLYNVKCKTVEGNTFYQKSGIDEIARQFGNESVKVDEIPSEPVPVTTASVDSERIPSEIPKITDSIKIKLHSLSENEKKHLDKKFEELAKGKYKNEIRDAIDKNYRRDSQVKRYLLWKLKNLPEPEEISPGNIEQSLKKSIESEQIELRLKIDPSSIPIDAWLSGNSEYSANHWIFYLALRGFRDSLANPNDLKERIKIIFEQSNSTMNNNPWVLLNSYKKLINQTPVYPIKTFEILKNIVSPESIANDIVQNLPYDLKELIKSGKLLGYSIWSGYYCEEKNMKKVADWLDKIPNWNYNYNSLRAIANSRIILTAPGETGKYIQSILLTLG